MKLSSVLTCSALLFSSSAVAFTTTPLSAPLGLQSVTPTTTTTTTGTQLNMFGGGGEGMATEDDPEAVAKMEQAAKSMGMSLEEYQLGIRSRKKLNEELCAMRIIKGDTATVSVSRDGNNPPQFMEITITDAGKELGPDAVSSALVTALKQAQESARAGRAEAQKKMMAFIGEEMKRIGSA